jgi:hypothetical protein
MAGLVAAIYAFLCCQDVDARDKRGHDGGDWRNLCGKRAKDRSPSIYFLIL